MVSKKDGKGTPLPEIPNVAGIKPPKAAPIFYLVVLIYTAAWFFVTWRQYELPPIVTEPVDASGVPRFSEAIARSHVAVLAGGYGMRAPIGVVGTESADKAEKYIVQKLQEYKEAAAGNPYVPDFEIFVETAHGSHRFDFMGEVVMKVYTNITNVVVRLSCGDECNKNSLLLNSHFDTQIVTPGACDDACAVAVMLEIARIVSLRQTPMRNSVILLFNGAEESLQDASHAFVTTSPLAANVRAFLNLESMGNHGKEILFQSNSREMVDAYKVVPHPHGSAVSNDIFMTGLILSDTDFRQFVDYGDLHGLDFATYQNSYTYHTMLDMEENLEDGLLQHMGDNAVALVQHLCGDIPIETFTKGRNYIYLDLFGYFFIVYDWATADAGHAAIILTAILLAFRTSFVGIFADTAHLNGRQPSPQEKAAMSGVGGFLPLLWTYGGIGFSIVSTIAGAVLLGAFLQFGLERPLTYFRRDWLPILLFTPAGLAAMLGSQVLARIVVRTHPLDRPVDLERRSWNATMLWHATLLLITTVARLGSSYIFAFLTASISLGLLIDRLLSPSGVNAPNGSHHPIHPLAYAVAYPIVASFGIHHLLTGLAVFVPLSGRIGVDAPVDVIVGGLVGLMTTISFSAVVLPLSARVSRKTLIRAWLATTAIAVLVAAAFATSSFPYDDQHPKRIFVQYLRNATSGERQINLAHSDPAQFAPILDSVSNLLGVEPVEQHVEGNPYSWSTVFPFSQFIVSHKFDITEKGCDHPDGDHPLCPGHRKDAPTPKLVVHEDIWDSGLGARNVTLRCLHPEHLLTVITFEANILDWSLSAKPDPGHRLHVVRQVGGHMSDIWNMTLSFTASSPEERLRVSLSAVEGDTFTIEPQERTKGGRARLGFVWGKAFESARVFGKIKEAIPNWATEMYLAVVTAIAAMNLPVPDTAAAKDKAINVLNEHVEALSNAQTLLVDVVHAILGEAISNKFERFLRSKLSPEQPRHRWRRLPPASPFDYHDVFRNSGADRLHKLWMKGGKIRPARREAFRQIPATDTIASPKNVNNDNGQDSTTRQPVAADIRRNGVYKTVHLGLADPTSNLNVTLFDLLFYLVLDLIPIIIESYLIVTDRRNWWSSAAGEYSALSLLYLIATLRWWAMLSSFHRSRKLKNVLSQQRLETESVADVIGEERQKGPFKQRALVHEEIEKGRTELIIALCYFIPIGDAMCYSYVGWAITNTVAFAIAWAKVEVHNGWERDRSTFGKYLTVAVFETFKESWLAWRDENMEIGMKRFQPGGLLPMLSTLNFLLWLLVLPILMAIGLASALGVTFSTGTIVSVGLVVYALLPRYYKKFREDTCLAIIRRAEAVGVHMSKRLEWEVKDQIDSMLSERFTIVDMRVLECKCSTQGVVKTPWKVVGRTSLDEMDLKPRPEKMCVVTNGQEDEYSSVLARILNSEDPIMRRVLLAGPRICWECILTVADWNQSTTVVAPTSFNRNYLVQWQRDRKALKIIKGEKNKQADSNRVAPEQIWKSESTMV
ncbi:hypothetical protein HDU97_001868 [Phlyctochytrium planicorne]|nr:hypothetical protein HDU97_001868 [Phlyctochytrium planicorne]